MAKGKTNRDIGDILGMVRELADYEKLLHECVAMEKQFHEALFGDTPRAEALIGELDDEPIAFALFFHNFSTFVGKPGLYLEDLYVKPNMRGQGFGRRLLRHVARLALERGCGRLEWSVLDWNKSAIGFYEKLGAQEMNDWTVYRLTGDNLDTFGK